MIDEQALRQGLQRLLKDTESAIRERLSDEPSIDAQLRERHAAAVRAERTEGSAKGYNAFADEAITQAAVHWLLGCVFVRFLEDNGWLDERNAKVAWIAGTGERLWVARDRRTLFLRPNPNLTDRDYLLHVFAEVAKLPGVAGLFDPEHNPLYLLQPTGQGGAKIVEFFQRVDTDSNQLLHDFTDPAHGTRFLGDLYQNLSESARKRYALCQTPGFVIDFILDRTLAPALDAFGLETTRLIDPSCGSGHFLLSAFARLFRAWQGKEPGTNPPALAQRALNVVYGVDLNPFAVEISRFRLLVAALESSGIERLSDAPDFRFNVAAGDSLLHGSRVGGGGIARELFEDRLQHFYDTEDAVELRRILGQTYHVVVGNPPYINVSDPVLRDAYRSRFATCHGKYQLGVPFTERFFDLTIGAQQGEISPAGWMGMIVSNAFMKRTFGKRLIEVYLRNRDLTHVIDTSGVYLPGHGTPTAILLSRHRQPTASVIRAVRGIRGETQVPDDPPNAAVWRAIVDHVDEPGYTGPNISVADVPRTNFERHPWSIGGGGAAELKELIEEAGVVGLGAYSRDVGIVGITGAEEALIAPVGLFARRGIHAKWRRLLLTGKGLGDWQVLEAEEAIFPYGHDGSPTSDEALHRWLWPLRTTLGNRATFSRRTYFAEGRPWWGWHQVSLDRLDPPESIAFSDVATHCHFVFVKGDALFDQHAPLIKIDSTRTMGLLGLLNSSSGCFRLKQVLFPKGGDHVGTEGARVTKNQWEERYEFDTTKLKQFPVPAETPFVLTSLLQAEVDARSALLPEVLCAAGVPERSVLNESRSRAEYCLGRMIALQEELDWRCYQLYGIIDEDLTLRDLSQLPALKLGERAFEIQLSRHGQEAIWFERHHSNAVADPPEHWPETYRDLLARRIAIIEANHDIGLMERPEYKRRWNLPTWEVMESAAIKNWLLNRIESNDMWKEHALVSCAKLRDALARNLDWLSVAETYHGAPLEDFDQFVMNLVTNEAVAFLPVLRYTDAGLRKRTEWEEVWKLQRIEDAGQKVEIPEPPKYISKDFQSHFWRLRGSLDVPKERFILYPGFQRDSDETPVLGWAGWSHLEQAQTLAAYYQRMRDEEGWEPERLKPVLAGMLDLREWLKQWHDDVPDPETGLKLGTYFSDFVEAQCQELGFSTQEVLAWKSVTGASAGRRKKSKTK